MAFLSRRTTRMPMNGIAGSTSSSPSNRTSEVSPRASPPSAISAHSGARSRPDESAPSRLRQRPAAEDGRAAGGSGEGVPTIVEARLASGEDGLASGEDGPASGDGGPPSGCHGPVTGDGGPVPEGGWPAAGPRAAADDPASVRARARVRASTTRLSPPNNSTWAAVSLNDALLVYCSGSVHARTSAPAGAHCGPTSRPTRPPNASTATAPRMGPIAAAAEVPCTQNAPARSNGRPDMSPGTTEVPWAENPMLANVSPGCAPPKAASDCGIGSEPCCAIQYPVCR